MSVSNVVDTAERQPAKLRGHMGVGEVALTVLAFSAPLTVAWGYLPFVIFFGGVGAPISFIVAMILLLIFSVGFVAMSRSIPKPGAFYAFVTHGINKSLGLGAAFLATVGYFLLISGVSSFFGITAGEMIVRFGGPSIDWYWLTALLLLVVGAFGYVGIELSAKTLAFFLLIEVLIVSVYDVGMFFNGGANGLTAEPLSIGAFLDGDVGLGVMFAIVMFIGFEATAIFREEARDPDRTIPRATYLSVAFIGLFYALTAWLLITAVGTGNAVDMATNEPATMFPGSFEGMLGTVAHDIAAIFVVTSVFASTLATHNIFSRYMFNLGTDGALPKFLGAVHPKQASPHKASLVASAASFLMMVIVVTSGADPGTYYGRAAGVASLCLIFLMLLTTIAVLIYFRRNPRSEGSRIWATRIAPGLATLGLGAVVVLALMHANDFMGSTTGLSIVFITGIVALFITGVLTAVYLKRRRPEVYARLGRQSSS